MTSPKVADNRATICRSAGCHSFIVLISEKWIPGNKQRSIFLVFPPRKTLIFYHEQYRITYDLRSQYFECLNFKHDSECKLRSNRKYRVTIVDWIRFESKFNRRFQWVNKQRLKTICSFIGRSLNQLSHN